MRALNQLVVQSPVIVNSRKCVRVREHVCAHKSLHTIAECDQWRRVTNYLYYNPFFCGRESLGMRYRVYLCIFFL